MWGIEASLKRENMVHNHQDGRGGGGRGRDRDGDGVDARANTAQFASETGPDPCLGNCLLHRSRLSDPLPSRLGEHHGSSSPVPQIDVLIVHYHTIRAHQHTVLVSSSHGCSVILMQS